MSLADDAIKKAKTKKENKGRKLTTLNLKYEKAYPEDIAWFKENILPGYITWVSTIDAPLFFKFLTIYNGSKVSDVIEEPKVTGILGDHIAMHSLHKSYDKGEFPDGMDTITALNVFCHTAPKSEYEVPLKWIKKYSEDLSNAKHKAEYSGKGSNNKTPFIVFAIGSVDEPLKKFVQALKELYHRLWGAYDIPHDAILPPAIPKIVFVTMQSLPFPTFLRRTATFVNFDSHVGKSKYAKALRTLDLYYNKNSTKFEDMAFPATLMEQTVAVSNTCIDAAKLLNSTLLDSTPGIRSMDNPPAIKDVGGFKFVKDWSNQMKKYIGSKHYVMSERPRGILLVGPPGTGKSYVAKAISSIMGWTGVELDISEMIGGIQGESETNMDIALNTIRQINNCVVLLDEVEKALGGTQSSSKTDGGVLLRIVNKLLRFMEEDSHSAILVMTANSVKDLPPPLMRSGRLDMILMADVPKANQREEILKIHLSKRNMDILVKTDSFKSIIQLTPDYSAAEIKQLVSNVYRALVTEEKMDLIKDVDSLYKYFEKAIESIIPIAKSRKDELLEIRKWAKDNTIDAHTGK